LASTADGDRVVACTRDVHRSYRLRSEEVHALRGVDVSVNQSEFVTLIGRSGSGKTTLLNIIAGLDRPTSGFVNVLGHDTETMSDEQLAGLRRENIGIIFQSSALMPLLTAVENVELPLRILGWSRGERERRAREALEIVAMAHRGRHRPYELSGGEQQRVGIARAIAPRPALILADEPTGELDSVSAQRIFGLFRSLVDEERVTVLAATHDRAIIRQADRILELRDGNVVDHE
jgi:putative ABC transport system ATP-binding protein